jgi:MFS family permease
MSRFRRRIRCYPRFSPAATLGRCPTRFSIGGLSSPQSARAWQDLSSVSTLVISGRYPGLNWVGTISDSIPYRGIIVLPSFKKTFGLNVDGPNAYQAPSLSANIVTTLQAGAVIGSLLAYTVADRFGRRFALLGGSVLFLLGCALQLIAHLSQSIFPSCYRELMSDY